MIREWRKIARLLGYSNTHCMVIEKIMESTNFVDVYDIQEKLGMSRSLISKVLKELAENGIIEKKRYRHRFVYRVNEDFLYCMYESFIRQLRMSLDQIGDSGIGKQIERIREHISKFRGD